MKYVPLPTSFMLISIIGFFISLFVVYPVSPSFGFAFMLVFIVMFIASMVSMTQAEIETRDSLYLHGMPKHVEKHRARVKKHVKKKKK